MIHYNRVEHWKTVRKRRDICFFIQHRYNFSSSYFRSINDLWSRESLRITLAKMHRVQRSINFYENIFVWRKFDQNFMPLFINRKLSLNFRVILHCAKGERNYESLILLFSTKSTYRKSKINNIIFKTYLYGSAYFIHVLF